jgi:phosphoglycerol transferase MdoB-like AlkP superfamily enzyme
MAASSRLRSLFLESRYLLILALALLFLAASLATRLGLLAMQHAVSKDGLSGVLAALGAGEAFDLTSTLWLVAPLAFYLAVLPERWFRHPVQRVLFWAGLGVTLFGTLFVAVVEFFFFSEFDSRFNFVAVDYLLYPTEVVDNVWESYPTGRILALLAAVTVLALVLLRKPLGAAWLRPASGADRVLATCGLTLLLLGTTAAVSPALAHVSEDRALNETAGNGYYSFWEALLGSGASYEGLYATRPEAALFRRLERLLAEPASGRPSFADGSTLRPVCALAPERRMNVVVVLEESLGSEFIGALHPRDRSLTPAFDALAAQGTLLTHAYSTGNRTIRALEATTSSLPPLPGISIVRRPQSENLFTLPALLRDRGYQTLFVYGGRALFDGMGRYFENNGVDRIVEQSDYPAGTFKTAWGVSDEAIFDRALLEMDAMHGTGRPFYSLLLTTSNHRPFDFPQDRLRWDHSLPRRENAVRYADFALGRFLAGARSHAFFADTLFVVMGDHGARVYGAAEIPLASYEVPILFYAPSLVPAGRRVATLASSLDVPPTLLGLLGFSYSSKFFGHDAFRIDPSQGRALMTHNREVALLRGGRIAVLGLQQRVALYGVDAATGAFTPVRQPDAAGRELIEDTIAYYAGANREYEAGKYVFEKTRPDRLAARSPHALPPKR